jgi:CMP-2-keto-3-deoxyoctulosonic acid synthetase
MQGAPERKDMPVINAEKVNAVVKHLEKGTADILPPYSKDVQTKLQENWQHRAGIIR